MGLAAAVHAREVRRADRPAVSRRRPSASRPRTRWRTTSRRTRSTSSCRCARASGSIACGATATRYIVDAGDRRFEADHVVVAMATYQAPRVPDVRADARSGASCSCTRSEYRNPGQLQPGDVLIVGAGNSGADIAIDVARSHRTWLSGGIPATCRSASTAASRASCCRCSSAFVFHRMLTVRHADGPAGAPRHDFEGRPADPREAGGPRGGRRRARAAGRPAYTTASRCSRTAACSTSRT